MTNRASLVSHSVFVAALVMSMACHPGGIGYFHEELSKCWPDCSSNAIAVTVEPAYANAANWNTYVRRTEPARAVWNQPYVACDGTEVGLASCLHAGELRKAVIPGVSSCSGLSAVDAVDAFEWRCDDSQDSVVVYSRRLRSGLRSLVDASGFAANHLEVQLDGANYAVSNDAVWWDNGVVTVTPSESPIMLDTPNTVYVVASAQNTAGFAVNADGIAVVTLADTVVTYSGTSANCVEATGEVGATADAQCAIAVGGQRFVWLEVNLDAAMPMDFMIRLVGLRFSQLRSTAIDARSFGSSVVGVSGSSALSVRDLTVINAGTHGITADVVDHSLFDSVAISSATANGMIFDTVTDSSCRGLRLDANGYSGIYVDKSSRNSFTDLVLSNTQYHFVDGPDPDSMPDSYGEGYGLALHEPSSDNVVSRVLTVGNFGSGVFFQGTTALNNTLAFVTAVNDGASEQGSVDGVTVQRTVGSTVVNAVTLNDEDGVSSLAVDDTFIDVVAAHCDVGVLLFEETRGTFSGNLWVGNNGNDCEVNDGTQPGLIGTTCTDTGLEGSSTYTGQLSTATLHIDRSFVSALVGKVTTDDPVNPNDNNGAVSFESITDWNHFSAPFRAWGRDGGNFPAADNRGRCNAGDTCRIWDYRVRQSDTQLRNVHGDFVAGAACPSSVDGDVIVTDAAARTFLLNAFETIGDDVGNDNGLCESSEACVFAPNLGAYQGEGELTAPCQFVDGAITGVTLRAYAINGQ